MYIALSDAAKLLSEGVKTHELGTSTSLAK